MATPDPGASRPSEPSPDAASGRRVVVVGGGAAGTLVAIHLAAQAVPGALRVQVVEPAEALGEGVAYSTRSSSHLLNVRSSGMSAFPDQPGHFTEWLRGQGIDEDGTGFQPRMLLGRYLRDTLDAARAVSGTRVDHVRGRVATIDPRASAVTLDDGRTLDADALVLATGHALTRPGWLPDTPAVIVDPWAPGALDPIDLDERVVIVGSGLTAVDVSLSLVDRGHRATMTMTSSHGLLPMPHLERVLPTRPPVIAPGSPDSASVRGLVRALRADAATADDWRQTIDGARPATVAVWRGLPESEQRRALRHVGRLWEVRRHRMAPQVAARIEALRAAGRLAVRRGRVTGVTERDGALRVTLGRDGAVLPADRVIMCIGPSADPAREPVLADAIRQGVLAPHPLGMGLAVDAAGRACDAGGRATWPVWAVGSLRKGAEWESTAVPELRLHAAALATAIGESSEH
ncbi:MAG: FAD/NAD(P)-binding protein [Chloroflexi bacterium]|nr:FAD/NAD(P)-binding protein [Chloroflexota bacterium]